MNRTDHSAPLSPKTQQQSSDVKIVRFPLLKGNSLGASAEARGAQNQVAEQYAYTKHDLGKFENGSCISNGAVQQTKSEEPSGINGSPFWHKP